MKQYETPNGTVITLNDDGSVTRTYNNEVTEIALDEHVVVDAGYHVRNLKDCVLVTGLTGEKHWPGIVVILPKDNFNVDQARWNIEKYYSDGDRAVFESRESYHIIFCSLAVMQPIVEYLFGLEPLSIE